MNPQKKQLLEYRRHYGINALYYFGRITTDQNSMEGLRYNTKALSSSIELYIKAKEHYKALIRITKFLKYYNRGR